MAYSKNDIVQVTIEDIGVTGEGIGKIDGYTLFVKDTVIGDVVEVKIMKAKKNYGYARLMNIITPSKDRVTPECNIARQCGGCQLQAMSYAAQLKYKQKLVSDNLQRIGGLTEGVDYEMCDILGMDTPFRYRNKAQYPVGEDKDGNIIMGFYAGHTHSIIPCDDCLLGDENNSVILTAVRQWMKDYRVRAYNENIHKGTLRHILIRTGFHTDEIMVCLVTKKMLRKEAADGLVRVIERLNSGSSASDNISSGSDNNTSNNSGRKLNIASLVVNINKEDTNVILGRECVTLYGRPYIEDYIGDIKFQISPLSFYQVNPVQTEVLYGTALEYAGLTGHETVWDLYCGIGTISLFLAQKAEQVYGVEIVPQAIDDAKKNAEINALTNAEFFVGKAEEVLPGYYADYTKEYPGEHAHADVIVVDPPRKGCEQSVLDTMVQMEPERIVYVSCDSATLARDVKYLRENGYEIRKVKATDMFPMSVHVESIVLLSHKSPDSVINVKVEFGEGDDKISLDAIAERAKKYQPKPKITYKMIQEYVEKKYGFKVHTAYIAEVKRSLGLTMYDAPNATEELKQLRKRPPKEKVEAITEALKYFEEI